MIILSSFRDPAIVKHRFARNDSHGRRAGEFGTIYNFNRDASIEGGLHHIAMRSEKSLTKNDQYLYGRIK